MLVPQRTLFRDPWCRGTPERHGSTACVGPTLQSPWAPTGKDKKFSTRLTPRPPLGGPGGRAGTDCRAAVFVTQPTMEAWWNSSAGSLLWTLGRQVLTWLLVPSALYTWGVPAIAGMLLAGLVLVLATAGVLRAVRRRDPGHHPGQHDFDPSAPPPHHLWSPGEGEGG